jgi:hypothetical protein
VLVSDAVRVLQKDLTAGLGVAGDPELAFSAAASFCCTSKPRASKHLVEQEKIPRTHAQNRPPESVDYLGLRHEHDLRVDLVGLRLRLLKLGEHVSIQTEIAPHIEKRRARYRIGGKIGGKHSGRRRNLELDVEHAAEQLGGQIVEAHLVSGDLVHGRLHLKVPEQHQISAQNRANQHQREQRKGVEAEASTCSMWPCGK